MLETAKNVKNFQNLSAGKTGAGKRSVIVQIYEIQTPDEARIMIELGVDHIGSVIASASEAANGLSI